MDGSLDRCTSFFSVPLRYDAVVSPCRLFSRGHDHVIETSRVDHYRTPCYHRRIVPLVPTSVGWDDRCISVEVQNRNPSAVLPLPSFTCFWARRCRRSCFPLRLVFGQPATSPSLPLLRPLAEQAVSPSSSTTSRWSLEEDRDKKPSLHRRPWLSSWRCSSPSTGRL
jgi:hypothetical protein